MSKIMDSYNDRMDYLKDQGYYKPDGYEQLYYQDFQDSVNKLLNSNIKSGSSEYNITIPEELGDYAENGYGGNWFRNMFQLQTDDMSADKNSAMNSLDKSSAMIQQGGLNNSITQRARDRVKFGYAKDTGKVYGALAGQNEAVAADARQKLSMAEQDSQNYDDYVSYLNKYFKHAGGSLMEDFRLSSWIKGEKEGEDKESAAQSGGIAVFDWIKNMFSD